MSIGRAFWFGKRLTSQVTSVSSRSCTSKYHWPPSSLYVRFSSGILKRQCVQNLNPETVWDRCPVPNCRALTSASGPAQLQELTHLITPAQCSAPGTSSCALRMVCVTLLTPEHHIFREHFCNHLLGFSGTSLPVAMGKQRLLRSSRYEKSPRFQKFAKFLMPWHPLSFPSKALWAVSIKELESNTVVVAFPKKGDHETLSITEVSIFCKSGQLLSL